MFAGTAAARVGVRGVQHRGGMLEPLRAHRPATSGAIQILHRRLRICTRWPTAWALQLRGDLPAERRA